MYGTTVHLEMLPLEVHPVGHMLLGFDKPVKSID